MELTRRRATVYQGFPVETLADIGLNGITPARFRREVAAAGFVVESITYNARGRSRMLPALTAMRRIPLLERWATVSIYTVLH